MEALRSLVGEHGPNWAKIAKDERFAGRNKIGCRNKWRRLCMAGEGASAKLGAGPK